MSISINKRALCVYQLINQSGKTLEWIRVQARWTYPDRHSVWAIFPSTYLNNQATPANLCFTREDVDYLFYLLDIWFVNVYFATLEANWPWQSQATTRKSLPIFLRNATAQPITVWLNFQYDWWWNGRPIWWIRSSKKTTIWVWSYCLVNVSTKQDCYELMDLLDSVYSWKLTAAYDIAGEF